MGRRQRCGAEEGARVEVKPGHGCRAAGGVSAGRPRGERALTRSGHDAARRGQARGGRPGAARCWAGARWKREAHGGLRWAGLRGWAGKEAAARENRNILFKFPFSINFQITVFKYYFEQENDLF